MRESDRGVGAFGDRRAGSSHHQQAQPPPANHLPTNLLLPTTCQPTSYCHTCQPTSSCQPRTTTNDRSPHPQHDFFRCHPKAQALQRAPRSPGAQNEGIRFPGDPTDDGVHGVWPRGRQKVSGVSQKHINDHKGELAHGGNDEKMSLFCKKNSKNTQSKLTFFLAKTAITIG